MYSLYNVYLATIIKTNLGHLYMKDMSYRNNSIFLM